MFITIIALIIVVSILLSLVVLIQNPKGGGLNSSMSGVSNQVFGAKNSTDIVEKTTWYLALAIFVLCLISVNQMGIGNTDDINTQDTKIEKLKDDLPTGTLPNN